MTQARQAAISCPCAEQGRLLCTCAFDAPAKPKKRSKPKPQPKPQPHPIADACRHNAEPLNCAECRPHQCPSCGSRHATFKKMRVHMNSHQFRDCKFCGSPFAANSITQHEKFCVRKFEPTDDDCDAVPLRHLIGESGTQFTQACNFLEKCEHIPQDPNIALVIFPDREPAFLKIAHLPHMLTRLAPHGASVIPTTALKLLDGAFMPRNDGKHE